MAFEIKVFIGDEYVKFTIGYLPYYGVTKSGKIISMETLEYDRIRFDADDYDSIVCTKEFLKDNSYIHLRRSRPAILDPYTTVKLEPVNFGYYTDDKEIKRFGIVKEKEEVKQRGVKRKGSLVRGNTKKL